MKSPLSILVTDGNYKHSLAVVRSLGRSGIRCSLDISSHTPLAVSRFCRYTRKLVICPNPVRYFEEYVKWMESIYTGNRYDIIIPVGSESNLAVAELDPEMVSGKSITPDPQVVKLMSDKEAAIEKMAGLSVNVPRTARLSGCDQLRETYSKWDCPLVIKPVTGASAVGVHYVHSEESVKPVCDMLERSDPSQYIVQEYIAGTGRGFFGFYSDGRLLSYFMHERIREFPVTGGISIVARSVNDRYLFELGDHVLNALKWSGPCMLEFKYDPSHKKYTLIEVNPKLWGSLELAIASGVNFPELIVRHLMGEEFDTPEYSDGITFAWPIPWSLLCFASRIRGRTIDNYEPGRNGHFTDLSWSDPMPNVVQIITMPYYLVKEWHRT
jgi:predicted ATP-grasp superfamily ATP-dependent carboligase